MMRKGCLLLAMAVGLGAPCLGAQSTPDSIAIWTHLLQSGTVIERSVAVERLASLPAVAIPQASRSMMIAELRRLNGDLLQSAVPWRDDATGEYYMSLALAVAGLETPDAYRALVPAIGISHGIGQRVASLGDEAVPALRDLIARDYEKDAALATLGLVSYWADSTGSQLTPASRAAIVAAWARAYADTAFDAQVGLKAGLENSADVGMLPLALMMRDRARAAGGPQTYVANALEDVVASLSARERSATLGELARRAQRNIDAVCYRPDPARRGICESMMNVMSESVQHIEQGQIAPARTGLATVTHTANRAYEDGLLDPVQLALTGGAAQRLSARLP